MLDVLEYLDSARQPGDALFVSEGAQYTLAYYLRCGCSDLELDQQWTFAEAPGGTSQWDRTIFSEPPKLVIESHDTKSVGVELDKLDSRRIWLLLAEAETDERAMFVRRAARRGTVVLARSGGGADATKAELYLVATR